MKKDPLLASFITLGMVGALALSPAHAADLSADVSDAYITSTIDSAITDYIQAQGAEFDWLQGVTHVETQASGVNDTTLHIRLHVSYEARSLGSAMAVPLAVDFDVFLDCGESGPSARIDNLAVTAFVPPAPEIVAQIESAANSMLVAQTQAIIGPIWTQLGELSDSEIANVEQVCPHFEVAPSGDIYAEIDFVTGCINGRQEHRACGARHWGDGYDYLCVNGYWERRGGWCEPASPPGGERP